MSLAAFMSLLMSTSVLLKFLSHEMTPVNHARAQRLSWFLWCVVICLPAYKWVFTSLARYTRGILH